MSLIEFRAYGGTGSLIARDFLTLLALNAGGMAKDEHECVVYHFADDCPSKYNDYAHLRQVIANYNKLHGRGLGFLAPIPVKLAPQTLRDVLRHAFGEEERFSLESVYCSGKNSREIREILVSAFTSDPESITKELERSNRTDFGGDLAVSSVFQNRILQRRSFHYTGMYHNLINKLDDAKVFYAGSAYGGTASFIEMDIQSLLDFLKDRGETTNSSRKFRLYGLRALPYSGYLFERLSYDPRYIYQEWHARAQAYLQNIRRQNEDKKKDSYYYMNAEHAYWLDGLFLAGSEAMDPTIYGDMDHRFENHHAHLVDFSLAAQAMDALAGRLPKQSENAPHVYSYHTRNSDTVTLKDFFGMSEITYKFEVFGFDETQVTLDNYIRAVLLTLATIRGQMIADFANVDDAPGYVYAIFHRVHGDEPDVCPLVAKELENFLEEAKFIVMTLLDVMEYSKFRREASVVRFAEETLQYIYKEPPHGKHLSILWSGEEQNPFRVAFTDLPEFHVLDEMSRIKFHRGSIFGGRLRHEQFYLNNQGNTYRASAEIIANNMIQRTFEVYLAGLNGSLYPPNQEKNGAPPLEDNSQYNDFYHIEYFELRDPLRSHSISESQYAFLNNDFYQNEYRFISDTAAYFKHLNLLSIQQNGKAITHIAEPEYYYFCKYTDALLNFVLSDFLGIRLSAREIDYRNLCEEHPDLVDVVVSWAKEIDPKHHDVLTQISMVDGNTHHPFAYYSSCHLRIYPFNTIAPAALRIMCNLTYLDDNLASLLYESTIPIDGGFSKELRRWLKSHYKISEVPSHMNVKHLPIDGTSRYIELPIWIAPHKQ